MIGELCSLPWGQEGFNRFEVRVRVLYLKSKGLQPGILMSRKLQPGDLSPVVCKVSVEATT